MKSGGRRNKVLGYCLILFGTMNSRPLPAKDLAGFDPGKLKIEIKGGGRVLSWPRECQALKKTVETFVEPESLRLFRSVSCSSKALNKKASEKETLLRLTLSKGKLEIKLEQQELARPLAELSIDHPKPRQLLTQGGRLPQMIRDLFEKAPAIGELRDQALKQSEARSKSLSQLRLPYEELSFYQLAWQQESGQWQGQLLGRAAKTAKGGYQIESWQEAKVDRNRPIFFHDSDQFKKQLDSPSGVAPQISPLSERSLLSESMQGLAGLRMGQSYGASAFLELRSGLLTGLQMQLDFFPNTRFSNRQLSAFQMQKYYAGYAYGLNLPNLFSRLEGSVGLRYLKVRGEFESGTRQTSVFDSGFQLQNIVKLQWELCLGPNLLTRVFYGRSLFTASLNKGPQQLDSVLYGLDAYYKVRELSETSHVGLSGFVMQDLDLLQSRDSSFDELALGMIRFGVGLAFSW